MQSNEALRRERAVRIWLEYYNRRLRDEKVITESEYFRMAGLIRGRYPEKSVQREAGRN
jgi:hypothetical protein